MADDVFYFTMGKKTDRMTGFVTPYWPHLTNEERGKYAEVFDFSQKICTEFNTDIGELKALVQARGEMVSNFNHILNADPDKYDASVGLSVIQNTQAEFDQLVHGIITQINDLLAPNKKMDELIVENEDGSYSRYRNVKVLDEDNCCVGEDGKKPPQELFTRSGCERYRTVKAFDKNTGEWRDFYIYNEEDVDDTITYYANNGKTYRVFNPQNTSVATVIPKKDAQGNALFNPDGSLNIDSIINEEPYTPWNKKGNEKYLKSQINGQWVLNEDYYFDTSKQYTCLEVGVNYELLKHIKNIPHVHQNNDIAHDMALKLASLWDNTTLSINPRFTNVKYTYSEYYKEMVGEIGIIGSVYESTAEKLEGTVSAVENQRNEVIGVSSDEELTRMIKYQNAYNASSRYIQTVSDMIEMLVTGL